MKVRYTGKTTIVVPDLGAVLSPGDTVEAGEAKGLLARSDFERASEPKSKPKSEDEKKEA